MNEKDVVRRSIYIFLGLLVIMSIVSVLFKDASFVLGLIVGYIINCIVFQLIIKASDEILKTSMSTLLIVILNVLKMILYALGFLIAVKSQYVHILGVFIGYMITKIAIYLEGYIHKGGE